MPHLGPDACNAIALVFAILACGFSFVLGRSEGRQDKEMYEAWKRDHLANLQRRDEEVDYWRRRALENGKDYLELLNGRTQKQAAARRPRTR